MWDRPRPVSAASVAVLLAVLLAGIPAPTRGACEGDNATAVALCNSLVGTVLNSPFNATRIAYVCDPEVLYSDYRCLAMGMNHTIHARPHLMETRDVAPDGRRHVVDERGKPKREPNLDEFMKTFGLVPEQPIQYSRDDTTSVELSPVLDGHEKSRSRRAKLLLELEEAVPEAPAKMVLPPAWSDA